MEKSFEENGENLTPENQPFDSKETPNSTQPSLQSDLPETPSPNSPLEAPKAGTEDILDDKLKQLHDELVNPQPEQENTFTDQPNSFLTQTTDPNAEQKLKKENGWIKLLRIIIWIGVAIILPIGVSLRESSELSQALADGTDKIEGSWGDTLTLIALIVGGLNLIWGFIRWILRIKRDKCSAGRIIGKLIGGGIWRTLVFTPIVFLSFFVFANLARDSIRRDVLAEGEMLLTSSEKIEIAYQKGEISTDEYVNNILLSYFDSSSLPEELKGESDTMVPDFARLVEDNYDELSDETKLLYFDIFSFQNIEFGLDASKNEETSYLPSFFSQNAYAKKSEHRVTTLNKAKLSDSGKFIVFYTDTGRDKITDAEAKNACDILDESVEKYRTNLGLDYEYEKFGITPIDMTDILMQNPELYTFKRIEDAQNEVLIQNGIEQGISIFDTAMPVYIIDPYNNTEDAGGAIAFYSGRQSAEILIRIVAELYSGADNTIDYLTHVQSFPLITVFPDKLSGNESISTPAVISHELGHHYQKNFCYNKTDKNCKSTNFTTEGTANMMSINVMQYQPKESILNFDHYNGAYLQYCLSRISVDELCPDFLGYPAIAWFENLYEQTGDMNGILEMLLSANELKTAEDIFGVEVMKNTLTKLAERNLLDDYDPSVYLKTISGRPKGTTLSCEDMCEKNYKIGYSQIGYFYVSASQYKDTTINFSSKDGVIVSLLGRHSRDGKWEVIESGKEELELKIPENPSYHSYALAIINYSTTEKQEENLDSFSIKVAKNEVEDLFKDDEDEASEILGDIFADGCFELDTDALLNIPMRFLESGADIAHTVANLSEEDHSKDLEEIDNSIVNIKSDIDKTKSELSAYKIDICGNKLNKDISLDEAKTALLKAMTGGLTILDNKDGDSRTVILAGYNLVQQSGKIFALIGTEKETALVTVNVVKR